jgi:Fe2+ or Zn2+ uptake regulation protein
MGRRNNLRNPTIEEMCEGAEQSPVEHFIVCPSCGQVFDCRDEAQVRHHSRSSHEPKLSS